MPRGPDWELIGAYLHEYWESGGKSRHFAERVEGMDPLSPKDAEIFEDLSHRAFADFDDILAKGVAAELKRRFGQKGKYWTP